MSKLNVNHLLRDVDPEVIKVLIEHSNPKSNFLNVEIPNLMSWRFCDIIDMENLDITEIAVKVMDFYSKGSVKTVDIAKAKAGEYASFLSYLKTQLDTLNVLMRNLESEPDPDMINAGVDKLNRFGVTGIYYSISKDPTQWDRISETAFGIMYTKLLLDKTHGEIQESYNNILVNKPNQ